MVQHVLLVSVAAPILAAARPLDTIGAAAGMRVPTVCPTSVVVLSGAVQVVTLLGWHVPAVYDAAVRHEALHGFEHVTLLATAFVLWSVLARARGASRAGAAVGVFLATLPAMALG